jgi:hypothetical protein
VPDAWRPTEMKNPNALTVKREAEERLGPATSRPKCPMWHSHACALTNAQPGRKQLTQIKAGWTAGHHFWCPVALNSARRMLCP